MGTKKTYGIGLMSLSLIIYGILGVLEPSTFEQRILYSKDEVSASIMGAVGCILPTQKIETPF